MIARFRSGVHWSLMQVEYATDLVFHKQDVLRPLYEALGFHPVSAAVWWRPNHTGDDRGEGLR